MPLSGGDMMESGPGVQDRQRAKFLVGFRGRFKALYPAAHGAAELDRGRGGNAT